MGIDAEDILVCVWICFKFVRNTSRKCVQKYPYFSGILIFFLLLYVFFNIFVSFFPLFLCTTIAVGFFLRSKPPTSQDVKGNEGNNDEISGSFKDDIFVNRDVSSSSCSQSSRRNVSENEKEDVQVRKKGKNMVSLESLDNDLMNRNFIIDKGNSAPTSGDVKNEQHPVTDHVSSSKPDFLANGGSSEQNLKLESAISFELEIDALEEAEEEDEEEVPEEGGGKAVEWTEDDQKNLVDLGLSEIERNKRLEILIARRRSRKSYKMQIENVIIKLDNTKSQIAPLVAPLVIERNMDDDVSNSSKYIVGFQVPGSAPSILLPNQNPFDLPYEPLEEKPNLMADSFHQEFAAIHQKEMLYCRHESFCYGPCIADKREGMGYSRLKRPSELRTRRSSVENISDFAESGSGLPTEETSSTMLKHEGDIETKSDMTDVETSNSIEQCVIENSHYKSTSSSSSEINGHIFGGTNVEGSKCLESTVGSAAKTFKISLPKGTPSSGPIFDSIPTSINKREKGIHTRTHSIASDLQVEVSENGSSPSYAITSNNSPTTFDGDIDKETISEVSRDDQAQRMNFDGEAYDNIRHVTSDVQNELSKSLEMSTDNNSTINKTNEDDKSDTEKSESTRATKRELESLFNPKPAAESVRQDAQTSSKSIEDAKNVGKTSEEPINPTSTSFEATISKLNDPKASEKEDKEKLMTVKESIVDKYLKDQIQPTIEGNFEARKSTGVEVDALTKSIVQSTQELTNPLSKFVKEDVSKAKEATEGEALESKKENESKAEDLKGHTEPATKGNMDAKKDVGDESNAVVKLDKEVKSEGEYKDMLKTDRKNEGQVKPPTKQNLEGKKDIEGEVVTVSKPNEPTDNDSENKEKLKTNKEREGIVDELSDLTKSIEKKLESRKDFGDEVATSKSNDTTTSDKEDKLNTEKKSEGGILEAIKDVASKALDTFKSNEAVESEKEDKEKLNTKKASEGKVEVWRDLTRPEEKPEAKNHIGGEVFAKYTSDDVVDGEKEDKLNI